MPTIDQIKNMTSSELAIANKKLAITLAKKIAVGVVVTVTVSLLSTALLNVIAGSPEADITPEEV